MDLKFIQAKLKALREKIKEQGHLSDDDQQELQFLMSETLSSASSELEGLQGRLQYIADARADNDNDDVIQRTQRLSEDQKKRLSILEKAGSCSASIH